MASMAHHCLRSVLESMRLATPLAAAGIGAVALIGATPSPSLACSGPECVEAEFFPGRGSVPANLPAVLFWPPARWTSSNDAGPDAVTANDLRFVRLEASGPVPIAFELMTSHEPSTRRWAGSANAPAYRIVPKSELQPGARYAVWARNCDGKLATEPPREPYDPLKPLEGDPVGDSAPRAPHAVFDVIASAPLPSALDNATVEAPSMRKVRIGGGSGCYEDSEAVTVAAEIESEGNPFFDAIAFKTYVDDKLYRPSTHLNYTPSYGNSWVGHGRDLLAVVCTSDGMYPLKRGNHRVRFEGTVAGTDVNLVGESVEIDLACPSDVVATRGAEMRDAAVSDAGAPADRTNGSATPPSRRSGGCSIARDANGGTFAMLLALFGWRRRRARS